MAHEDLSRGQHVESSSNRSFGLVFAAVFLLICLWPLFHREQPRWWALAAATAFALVALLRPTLLAWLNRQWTRLGVLLGKLISPVALGILFYGMITPLGVIARLVGKDPLRLRRDPGASTYWIDRQPPGPPPGSMTRQF